jgi:hypothetical protein
VGREKESLISRFQYEGRIGHFDVFAVMTAAIYSDESGGDDLHDRICIATSFATLPRWISFEQRWGMVLNTVPEHVFHAVATDHAQRVFNAALPLVMRECEIVTFCLTMRETDYMKATTPRQRSRHGNVFGFARYAALSIFSALIGRRVGGDVGYYVEQGGKGYAWIMERMRAIYGDDELRREYRMATFGPVDRREHLPVHTADLVAHEVITARHTSVPLDILGDHVEIYDVSGEDIENVIGEFAKLNDRLDRMNRDAKVAKKSARRRTPKT